MALRVPGSLGIKKFQAGQFAVVDFCNGRTTKRCQQAAPHLWSFEIALFPSDPPLVCHPIRLGQMVEKTAG